MPIFALGYKMQVMLAATLRLQNKCEQSIWKLKAAAEKVDAIMTAERLAAKRLVRNVKMYCLASSSCLPGHHYCSDDACTFEAGLQYELARQCAI